VTNASLRLLVLAGVLLLVVAVLTGVNDANAAEQRTTVLEQIDDFRNETWSWQRLMRVSLTPTSYSERTSGGARREWLRDLWRARAGRAEATAQDPRTSPPGAASIATRPSMPAAGTPGPATATTAACR
jgi:hypothetical protein